MDNNWNENNINNNENNNVISNQNLVSVQQNNPEPVQKSEMKQGSFDMNSLLKNKKVLIIGIIVVLLLLIFLVKGCGHDVSRYNGYTAKYGETLKIREAIDNFELKVLGDFGTHTEKDSYMSNGDYLTLKVSVKNNYDDTLTFSLTDFTLVDESKEKLVSADYFDNFDNSILTKEIAPGNTEEGILYFSENEGNDIKSKAKYLKVSVISNVEEKGNNNYNYEKEDYFIEIK